MNVSVNPANPANIIKVTPPSGGAVVTVYAGIAGPQGPQGTPGSDASVTSTNIHNALGYTPVNPSSLASVATSGSYSDLSNKPSSFTPSTHASTHRSGGSDPITISLSQLAQSSATTGQVAKWDGTHWVPSTPPSSNPFDQSLNTTDSATFAGQTINGTSSLDSGAITTNGAGNLRFLVGVDQYENPYYTTLNAGELQFGFNNYGDAGYSGITASSVSLVDPSTGGAGAGLTSSGVTGANQTNYIWQLGTSGLILNPSGIAVACISGTNGSVRFDGEAEPRGGTSITSDGNGNLTAASFIAGSDAASISGTDGSVVFDGLATNPIISDGNGNLRVNTLTTTAVLTYNDLYLNSTPSLGARALCSESNTKVLGAQITTRGSYVVPIYGDGSVWRVG